MTSRINYNTPLKSVRTIRALKIEQYDPQKAFVDDPGRPSDADLMHDVGIAFVWENAPGRSKVEQEKTDSASPLELKPPPQVLAPPPNSKVVSSVEVPKSPPVPAGTEPNGRSFHHLFDNSQLPQPAAAAAESHSPTVRSQPTANHQLPPKPTLSRPPLPSGVQQSGDKPPQPRRTTASAASVSQSGHHSNALLSRNGSHDQPSARRTDKTRGQDATLAKERHHHPSSSLSSVLQTLTNNGDASAPPPRTDPNGGGTFIASAPAAADEVGSGAAATALQNGLSRRNHEYLSARIRPSQSPAVGVKDFYLSGRHTLPSAVSSSAGGGPPTRPNSCAPTTPNSVSPSEAGSNSDDGDRTDVGDAFSTMNTRDPDGRCQVSMLDGDQHESSSSRHTDPHARDFIMERFLPAAKAMVTETPDTSERRPSPQETPLVSPTRKTGRSSLIGRSRFAFKDRFAEEEDGEEQEDAEQSDVLFKCKFPWQMGALRSAMPQICALTDSESAEQSPSPSFAKNNKYSPSPTASIENRKAEASPRPLSDGQRDDPGWIYPGSDRSGTPKGDNVCSFEARGLPPKSRRKGGAAIPRGEDHSRESDQRDTNRSPRVSGQSANGEYESENSVRSNESSCRASPSGSGGVPRDRLQETATQADCDMRSGPLGSAGRRSPELAYLGSLGSLLRTTQQQRRDLGRNCEAAIEAAVASVQEEQPIISPSSILNHHRNSHTRAAAPAAISSPTGGSKQASTTKQPAHPVNTSFLPDESHSYPKHLKVNLIKPKVAEPSGVSERSLESLNDEVWESARESPASVENDQSGKVLLGSNHSNFPESANESPLPQHAVGWPLVKVQSGYARTPSSDSKDASFSSLSELSLRSPTNLALTVQQAPSTEKYSPVSVLQPPLPKSPNDSWLCKVRPPLPPSTGTNWQGPKPKKFLDYGSPDDSMDVKWEVLVKSENAQLRTKMAQEVQQERTGLDKSDVLGSKAR